MRNSMHQIRTSRLYSSANVTYTCNNPVRNFLPVCAFTLVSLLFPFFPPVKRHNIAADALHRVFSIHPVGGNADPYVGAVANAISAARRVRKLARKRERNIKRMKERYICRYTNVSESKLRTCCKSRKS